MKTRFVNKLSLDKKYLPHKWMENLVSNGKIGGVILVFVEGFTEKEIKHKTKLIQDFCKTVKEKSYTDELEGK
jgi:hypothetical protein